MNHDRRVRFLVVVCRVDLHRSRYRNLEQILNRSKNKSNRNSNVNQSSKTTFIAWLTVRPRYQNQKLPVTNVCLHDRDRDRARLADDAMTTVMTIMTTMMIAITPSVSDHGVFCVEIIGYREKKTRQNSDNKACFCFLFCVLLNTKVRRGLLLLLLQRDSDRVVASGGQPALR